METLPNVLVSNLRDRDIKIIPESVFNSSDDLALAF